MTEPHKPMRRLKQSRTTRRVTLNVDEELLREAGEFLGTTSMTETINGALDEYVSLQMRLRAANRELALTPEMLDEIRKPRTCWSRGWTRRSGCGRSGGPSFGMSCSCGQPPTRS